MTDLTKTLAELQQWLEKVAPDELDELNEPASPEMANKLNEAYGGHVPEDVLALYAWHDGGQIPDPWWELSDIDAVIRTRELHESMPDLHEQANWWSDSWIPVAADDDGNHLCVDIDGSFDGTAGQVLIFMHDDGERQIVAPSLGVYLEVLLRACQEGVLEYDEEDGFMSDDNLDAWEDFRSTQIDGYPRVKMAGD